MIIAVDFDGTIVEDKFPEIGELKKSRFSNEGTFLDDLKKLKKRGHEIILFTCREGDFLKEAVNFCKEHGLKFNAVNGNVPSTIRWWKGGISRKPFANVYIDDRATNFMGENKDTTKLLTIMEDLK